MHEINFIHGDIKPENIMWSPFFQKFVFIDFGLSNIIKEEVGFKTFTSFSGTVRFSSEEMKKLYVLQEKGYVDLYHNDAVSLTKSLKHIEEISESNIPNKKI